MPHTLTEKEMNNYVVQNKKRKRGDILKDIARSTAACAKWEAELESKYHLNEGDRYLVSIVMYDVFMCDV